MGDRRMNPPISADRDSSVPGTDPAAAASGASAASARPWYRAPWYRAGVVVARQLPVVVPPLVWGVLGWHRRWITDDGLIVSRTVREILAGNGPVFNPGERVEADTSALWTWLLALFTWVSHLDVYTVTVWTGLVLAPLGLLFALLGARELHRRHGPAGPLLPVGAAVVLALPPFWDFATSGLEDSLVFCWLGVCWWLLAGLRADSRRRAAWLAFAAGLGWLVRPDMAIGTVGFLAAGWYIVRPGWWRSARLAVAAGMVPVAYEVFRMGYYGLLVPNTAVAKDASSADLTQGLTYLGNFAGPYRLWIPLFLLLALVPLMAGRLDRSDVVRCVAMVASGLAMAGYVIVIGGDFMHARMLLPPTFTLLLPVMMLPVPLPRAQTMRARAQTVRAAVAGLCVAALGAWAVVCGLSWRIAQLPGVIPTNGIADERAFWSQQMHLATPDSGPEYVLSLMGSASTRGSAEWEIISHMNVGKPVLLYQVATAVPLSREYPPFNRGYPVGVDTIILGTWGAGTPLDGLVVDLHGLSSPLGSHLISSGGRVGHKKLLPTLWTVAEYSDVTQAPGIPAAQLAAARKALSCGALAELDQATRAPLTFGRFMSNFAHALRLTTFRFSPDPATAEKQLCGPA